MELDLIRNFCIISHVDHGKSTLADRMLEITETVSREKMHPQMLDTMDLERERGITIKLQPVTMQYKYKVISHPLSVQKNTDNRLPITYTLNLIDTPGHVDFSYEVSRSLAAVEGAILLVDATQGIQAQTLANLHIAKEHKLKIIPVVNKIDLPGAKIEETKKELSELFRPKADPPLAENIAESEILECSAKTGEGIEKILEKIILDIPAPRGDRAGELKALIFDSVFDEFRGAIAYVRVFDGEAKKGKKIKFQATGKIEEADEVGKFRLKYDPLEILEAGMIGYIVTGERDIKNIKVGDTITHESPTSRSPIAGFKIPKPFVYASFYSQGGDPSLLRKSLEKLSLNDSSLNFTPEVSQSFGQGFRCGFLGLLHMEIAKVRLEREYNLDLIVTQPQVEYIKSQNSNLKSQNYEEPWVKLEIITPQEYLGPVMELAQSRRAIYLDTKYLGEADNSYSTRAILEYEAPLAEIIIDFYDKLKSISQGYASQNYEFLEYRKSDLVKMDILIAGEKVEEFSRIVPRLRVQQEGKNLVARLKELIPRQMFEVSLQAAIGGKIIARENIQAMKKDVTAKLYGGDVTRKNKLLKKQAKGKKKMKRLGKVDIPDNVFIDVLKS